MVFIQFFPLQNTVLKFPLFNQFYLYRVQAGKYHDALDLLKTAMKIEEKELGARPHRMVELYALMAEIYDEVCYVDECLLGLIHKFVIFIN